MCVPRFRIAWSAHRRRCASNMAEGFGNGNGPDANAALAGQPSPHGAAAPIRVGGRTTRRPSAEAGNERHDGSLVRRTFRRIGLTGYQWTLVVLLALYLVAVSPIQVLGG